MADEGQVISWEVRTHTHQERSNDWFWGLGVAAAVGAALSIFLGNVLLAIILIVGAGSLGILAARGPREHSVRIDARGVSIDGTLYRYDSLRSFWVDEEREGFPEDRRGAHLYISTTGIIAPHFTLALESGAQAEAVRSFLKKYMQEEEQGPHFGEHVAQMLGL
jgi:hypothetical protein